MKQNEEISPLFSLKEALELPVVAFITLCFSYFVVGSLLQSTANGHNPPEWVLDTDLMKNVAVEVALVLTTIIFLFWLKIRLQNKNNPEHLSSYLGFHEPNWRFWGKWTLIVLIFHVITWSSNITPTKDRVLEDVLQYGLWLPLIGTLIVAPICEEIFFRGILWTAIHDSVQKNSEQIAFWISGLAFAVGHMNFNAWAMVQYLAFSWLAIRARTHGGSLALAIWLHFLSNFLVMAEALWAVSQRVQAA